MKITTQNKAILWALLEKYDGCKGYDQFCDALSNLIQGKSDSSSLLVVYNYFTKLDSDDRANIDNSIGADLEACLFSI